MNSWSCQATTAGTAAMRTSAAESPAAYAATATASATPAAASEKSPWPAADERVYRRYSSPVRPWPSTLCGWVISPVCRPFTKRSAV